MRYPTIQLKDAATAVEKLFREIQRSAVDGNTASKALGYSSENGAARTKLAALNAYGLIDRGKKLTKVTELGVSVAHPLGDSRDKGLREAALNPPLFKEIWDNHRQCSESVLASTLVHRGLDADSAAQAAKIFKENVAFARLDSQGYVPPEKPDPQPPAFGTPPPGFGMQKRAEGTPPMTANIRYLPIPLDIGDAPIPVGMSEGDFQLLLQTLTLWKKKIVRSADDELPVTIDVSQFKTTQEGDYILPSFEEGADYRDLRAKTHIQSIGKRKKDGAILASTTGKFYENPDFECLWVR